MHPLFLGSHQATDFLNTFSRSHDKEHEFIADGMAFVQWLRLADLLNKEQHDVVMQQFTSRQLNLVAERARSEREWVRAWLIKLCAGSKSNYAKDAAHLNQLINLCRFKFALTGKPVRTGPTCAVERYPVLERPDALLGLVAEPVAHLVACEDLKLIRRCAQSDCGHWFLDATKSHKRLYCNAATCGNRAKVSAFRARAREQAKPKNLTRN
jgi:predicted RNA-binding Zn ribbon-like protein